MRDQTSGADGESQEPVLPGLDLQQWINWHEVPNPDPNKKPRKVPFDPVTGRNIDPHNPVFWRTYNAVKSPGHFTGFVLTDNDPYFCIDVDHCLVDGVWAQHARDICAMLPGAYQEISHSGDGLHIFGQGTVPSGYGTRGPGVEYYETKRFIAVTGTNAVGSADIDFTTQLAAFANRYLKPRGTARASSAARQVVALRDGPADGHEPITGDIETLVARMRNRRPSPGEVFGGMASFDDLWRGDVSAFPSESEADFAMAKEALWRTRGDQVLTERLMWQSALVRDKWDERDYLPRTILAADAALAGKYYQGSVAAAGDVLESDAPTVVAHAFSAANGDLRHHRGDFYRWSGSYWRAVSADNLRAEIYRWLEHRWYRVADGKTKPVRPDKTRVSRFLDALAGVCHLDDALEAPFWIEPQSGDPDPVNLLPFENGVLDLHAMSLRAPDPRLFSTHRVNCDYDPAALCPTWEAFMTSMFGDDPESMSCLEEIIGYCMSNDTSQQKAFLFQGASRSGKGTVGRVLRQLVGPERFCSPTVSSFGSNFGMSDFIGKSVAMIGDARGQSRHDPHVIVERILAVSGEDSLSIDRKYRDAWNGILPTRIIYVSNVPPKLKDPSGVVVSRFVAVNFRHSFLGQEDPTLTDRLVAELPGIANRALNGLMRLRERGRFTQPASGRVLLDQMDANTGPVRAFVRECCVIGPEYKIDSQTLYRMFCGWCRENGHREPAKSTFGSDLFALNLGIQSGRSKVRHAVTGKMTNGPPIYKSISVVTGLEQ